MNSSANLSRRPPDGFPPVQPPALDGLLSGLRNLCREAGANASTVIYSQEKVVVYYKGSRRPGTCEEVFDELHICPEKKACILIAVFYPEESG
jgi:hypothetical protein